MPANDTAERQPGGAQAFRTAIRLQAPLRKALHELLSVESWPEWRPGLMGISHVSDSPIMTASAWHERWRVAGKSLELAARVIEVGVPGTLSYAATGDGIEARIRWQVTQDDASLRIVQDAAARALSLRAWMRRLPGLFLVQQEGALAGLRERLRTKMEATDGAPA